MTNRYFFDLDDGREIIPDNEGIVATSVGQAISDAQSVLDDMRAKGDVDDDDKDDWELVIRDAGGSFVARLSIK